MTEGKMIPLLAKDGTVRAWTRVDDEDFLFLSQWTWRLDRESYARRKEGGRNVYMHRVVLGAVDGDEVDHGNLDKLDNRKCNLRLCSHSENCGNRGIHSRNRSGFKGVSWDSRRGKWVAQIQIGGRKRNLGRLDDVWAAHMAYRVAAEVAWGEFARADIAVENDQVQVA